MSGTAVRLEPR